MSDAREGRLVVAEDGQRTGIRAVEEAAATDQRAGAVRRWVSAPAKHW